MEKYEIEKLRSLPCEGVAQRLGLQVKRHKALCPFHDDHSPSLTFKNNKWKCWSCGESGDSISLVEKILHKDFREACRWMADEHNVILTEYKPQEPKPQKPFDASRYARYFEHPWLSQEARLFLYDERRIDPRVVGWCRFSSYYDRFNGGPWLSIPYYDEHWRLIGVQNRNLTKGASPRFRFAAGFSPSLYGLPVIARLKPGDALYIAEGVTDYCALLSSGRKAVAVPSATTLTAEGAELLSRLAASPLRLSFHIYPDADQPGQYLTSQLKDVLPGLSVHQLPPGCKDFSDYYLSKLQV